MIFSGAKRQERFWIDGTARAPLPMAVTRSGNRGKEYSGMVPALSRIYLSPFMATSPWERGTLIVKEAARVIQTKVVTRRGELQ